MSKKVFVAKSILAGGVIYGTCMLLGRGNISLNFIQTFNTLGLPGITSAATSTTTSDSVASASNETLLVILKDKVSHFFGFNESKSWTFLNTDSIHRGITVVLTGLVIYAAQQLADEVVSWIKNRFTLTAQFSANDDTYKWLLQWSSSLQYSKENAHVIAVKANTSDYGSQTEYTPGIGSHYFKYNGRHVKLIRHKVAKDDEKALEVQLFGVNRRKQRILIDQMVQEARNYANEQVKSLTVVYTADAFGNWYKSSSRPIRSMSSVILPNEVKDDLVADAIDFFKSREWYAERGIPFRRGYLLHGPPGNGKTSFITALAGILKIHIYVINLASKTLSDELLLQLLRDTPYSCVILMEDVDSAFFPSANDEDESDQLRAGVTFSGVLNAIDGVAAKEGSLLVMTTNHIEKLNSALIRDGRIDKKVKFEKATHAQIEEIFQKFYEDEGKPVDENDKKQFALCFKEKQVSMAEVQGLLMRHKLNPKKALETAKDEYYSSSSSSSSSGSSSSSTNL